VISPPVHLAIGEVEYDPEARDVAFYGRLSTLKGLDTFLRAGVPAVIRSPRGAGWSAGIVRTQVGAGAPTVPDGTLRPGPLIPDPPSERTRYTPPYRNTQLWAYRC
jgi:hypothetical protein